LGQDRKDFFFEKKKRKTFDLFGVRLGQRVHQSPKVFWCFFSRTNMLHYAAARTGARPRRNTAKAPSAISTTTALLVNWLRSAGVMAIAVSTATITATTAQLA
jgi:hypothetical protein